jgi:hypothetical protein
LVEIYQTKYPEHVANALKAGNFDMQHAGDLEWVAVDGEGTGDELKAKLKQQQQARMRMRRLVAQATWEAETQTVKEEVEKELKRVKQKRLESTEAEELTPELAQMWVVLLYCGWTCAELVRLDRWINWRGSSWIF